MTTLSRPLYTFEVPGEGLVIASFIPSEAGVTVDAATLLTQPLWSRAQTLAQALEVIALPAVIGFQQSGADGTPYVSPPYASVTRFNFGSAIAGCAAYLGWRGYVLPAGTPLWDKLTSITMVVASNFGTGSYAPYAEIDYSVLGSTPYTGAPASGWYPVLHDNTAGWDDVVTSLQLWPGNADVGPAIPNLNAIEIRISEDGPTTGSSPGGITFSVAAQLVLSFL